MQDSGSWSICCKWLYVKKMLWIPSVKKKKKKEASILLPACSASKYYTEALSEHKRTLSKIIKKIGFT